MRRLIKKITRSCGLEVHRYAPASSNAAQLMRLLDYHRISIVLDVGANIGQYARYIRDLGFQGRIVSFEPLADAHAQLLAASRCDPLWEIAPRGAIGDRDGEIVLNVSQNVVSSSALPMIDRHVISAPESVYVGQERVALFRLDTIATRYLAREKGVAFLKIDVQGLESRVLAGASGILPRISGIQLEMSLVPLYEGEPMFRDMLGQLDEMGFELHAVIPGLTDDRSGRLLQMDGIFMRKS